MEKGDGTMKKTYKIEVDCANCAAELENRISKVDGVENVSVSFIMQSNKDSRT